MIPLLFLAAVRRFLAESYTDMSFLPGYEIVDVRFSRVYCKFVFHKRFHALHQSLPLSKGKVARAKRVTDEVQTAPNLLHHHIF